jgi:hypothetical protein
MWILKIRVFLHFFAWKHPIKTISGQLIDWSNFSVAHWGWLEEGSFGWSALPLIQNGCYGRHLGFGFRQLEVKCLGRLIRFFCGLLGATIGKFLSMISSAAHPRCTCIAYVTCASKTSMVSAALFLRKMKIKKIGRNCQNLFFFLSRQWV